MAEEERDEEAVDAAVSVVVVDSAGTSAEMASVAEVDANPRTDLYIGLVLDMSRGTSGETAVTTAVLEETPAETRR